MLSYSKNNNNVPIYKQIIYYFSVYKKYVGKRLYVVFILTALAAVTEGFGIALLLPLIDTAGANFITETADQSKVKAVLQAILNFVGVGTSMVGIIIFIASIFLIKGGVVFSAFAYQSHLKSQLMCELKILMFDKFSTMDYGYYSKHNTGHFVNIINNQVLTLIKSFDHFKQFLATIITTGTYLATAFLIAWNFALMAIVAGVVLLFVFKGLNNYVHGLSRKTALEESTLNKFLVQTIQSFKYLASTAQMDHLRSGVTQSIRRLATYMRSQGIAQALTTALSEPFAICLILLVILVQVVVMKASAAPIFVALILFNRSMGSIFGILQAWQSTLSKIGSLEMVEKEFDALNRNQMNDGTTRLEPFEKQLEMRNVSFAYEPTQEEVLKDITLTIPVNSTVAFVGESGAGKSTLVDLLTLLLRPTRGEVIIDGVPGLEVMLSSWRSQIGYVSQETVVFDDTVANNICLWKDNYNSDIAARERIEKAARQAYSERFIQNLPDKFNTIVGDRGVRLSGGQRQRLFLARELYKNPRLLILDEATSALDSESESYIQKSIEALSGSATVVIIAHRLSTIKNADYIYVLEAGRIAEHGTYQQLMTNENGRFNRMVMSQNLSIGLPQLS